MTLPFRLGAGALVAAAIASCAPPEMMGTSTVDNDFRVNARRWTDGGGLVIAYSLEERAGQLAVCGAWATRRSGAANTYNDQLIRVLRVHTEEERLISDLAFMAQVDSVEALAGATASCANTGRAWSAAYAETPTEIRSGQRVFSD
ncbi:MAG: hypothetical protein AAGE18_12450 [Pseudomonadota bacterium]